MSYNLEIALAYLAQKDKVMKKLITQYKLEPLKPHKKVFHALCRSVVSQQLSVKAARTIHQRFLDLYPSEPTPEQVAQTPPETLRGCGLSNSKASYIHNIAEHALKGELEYKKLAKLENEELIQAFTKIKGVGRWTAEMLLMFLFGREDVFSLGDQGLKVAIQRLYKITDTNDKEQLIKISNRWKPHRTTAARLLWKSLDNQ